MRTAEEILAPKGYFVKHNIRCYEYNDVVRIINEVRKEAIEEAAKVADTDCHCIEGYCNRVDKQSILSLISELK